MKLNKRKEEETTAENETAECNLINKIQAI